MGLSVDRINGLSGSLALKAPVRAVATTNITLSGLQTIDGVAGEEDDRILLTGQTDATENGIWNQNTSAWTRALDFNGRFDIVQGTMVPVVSGNVYAGTIWGVSTSNPVIGTSAIQFNRDFFNSAPAATTVTTITGSIGQTVFTVPTYEPGANAVAVFANGIRLRGSGVDYTETNSTTITLTTGFSTAVDFQFVIGSEAAQSMSGNQVSFTRSEANAQASNVQRKLREIVSVADWGAYGDGTDQTAQFQLAAQEAPAEVNIGGAEGANIARAPMVRILVPAGDYTLSSLVDTGGREVTWIVDQGAVVTGYANLNGRLVRDGMRVIDRHHGTSDYACGFTVRSHADLEAGSEVSGYTTESDLGTFASRDTVTFFVDNTAPAVLADIATATYTATSIVPGSSLTADQVKQLRVGMLIDTKHATKYSGFITGWASDGSSITVEGWYLSPGPGTPATPTNGTGAYVNPFTKAWAHNANIILGATSHADEIAGFELGVLQNKAAYNPATDLPRAWGFDCVNLGSNVASVAFIQRGSFYYGFQSRDCNRAAFYIQNRPVDPSYGFLSEAEHGTAPFAYLPGGVQTWIVTDTGSVDAGSVGAAGTVAYDFHTSGNNIDYDSRIEASSGTASIGEGELRYRAGLHRFFAKTGGTSGESFRVGANANAVNFVQVIGSTAGGNGPQVQAEGSDTDIDLRLVPKGAGLVRFGTFTGTGDVAVNGFVTIKVADGTTIKLATVA